MHMYFLRNTIEHHKICEHHTRSTPAIKHTHFFGCLKVTYIHLRSLFLSFTHTLICNIIFISCWALCTLWIFVAYYALWFALLICSPFVSLIFPLRYTTDISVFCVLCVVWIAGTEYTVFTVTARKQIVIIFATKKIFPLFGGIVTSRRCVEKCRCFACWYAFSRKISHILYLIVRIYTRTVENLRNFVSENSALFFN